MLVCPSCNAEYESGKFCKKCGTKLIDKSAGPTHEDAQKWLQDN